MKFDTEEMKEKIWRKTEYLASEDSFYYTVVVLLVAVSSFGIGRWSSYYSAVPTQESVATVVMATAATSSSTFSNDVTSGQYVASKNGARYYATSCSGVSRIKEENKVFFTTEAAALASGYTPAANCSVLKGK